MSGDEQVRGRTTADARVEFAAMALTILREECGASTSDASMAWQFERAILTEERRYGVEFRFIGALGLGGKFHLHSSAFRWTPDALSREYRCSVSCYPEDRTEERDRMIAAANARLSALADEFATAFADSPRSVPRSASKPGGGS